MRCGIGIFCWLRLFSLWLWFRDWFQWLNLLGQWENVGLCRYVRLILGVIGLSEDETGVIDG